MKTAFIATMLGLASIATAGQKLVVAEPAAPAAPAWAVEVGAQYNWALGQFMKSSVLTKKNHVNTVGGDITGVYNIDENQAVTLRFGYTYGSDKYAVGIGGEDWIKVPNAHARERLHTFTLMPGYRYTYALNDKWSLYAGANVGIAANSAKVALTVELDSRSRYTSEAHKSAWGFAWGVEAGARYAVNETVDVFGAVTYGGNTARPNIKYASESVGKVKTQQTLGVRAGVSVKF